MWLPGFESTPFFAASVIFYVYVIATGFPLVEPRVRQQRIRNALLAIVAVVGLLLSLSLSLAAALGTSRMDDLGCTSSHEFLNCSFVLLSSAALGAVIFSREITCIMKACNFTEFLWHW